MEKIKVLFVGCGNMGARFARIAAQMGEVEIVGVCDKMAATAEKVGQELKAKSYTDHNKMMDAHPEAVGVAITTPEWAHKEPALDAIRRGLNVFVEKPVADTVKESEEIINAAAKKGIKLLVDHTVRFDARYIQARAAVQRGDIGEVVNVYGRRDVPNAIGNYVNGRTNLPLFLGVHEVDLISWVSGHKIVKVFAKDVTKVMAKANTHDCVASVMTLDNGALALCEMAWQVPPTQGRQQNMCLQVRGTEGVVDISTYENGVGIFNAKAAAHPDTFYMPDIYGRTLGVWPYAFMHFIDCIRLNKTPAMAHQDAVDSVKVALAMMESIKQGKEVQV